MKISDLASDVVRRLSDNSTRLPLPHTSGSGTRFEIPNLFERNIMNPNDTNSPTLLEHRTQDDKLKAATIEIEYLRKEIESMAIERDKLRKLLAELRSAIQFMHTSTEALCELKRLA